MGEWDLVDHTTNKGGYLRLQLHGQRVADFFPFAVGADREWLEQQARAIVDTMNGDAATPERKRCADIARSMGLDRCAEAIEMGATVQIVR